MFYTLMGEVVPQESAFMTPRGQFIKKHDQYIWRRHGERFR